MESFVPAISMFSNQYQNVVETYCGMINSCNADLIITMARKGVCFFDVLVDDGHISLCETQRVISSNAIEFTDALDSYNRIVITDDIMISGTSIANTVNRLLDIGVSEDKIEVIVLAVDSEYMHISFPSERGRNLLSYGWTLSNADCIELSSQISNLLAIYGKPYDVDFPVYDPIVIPYNKLFSVLNPNYFRIYNITNSSQTAGGIEALTLIPKERTAKNLWEFIGFPNVEFAHIKYRVFVESIDNNQYSVQVVPFALIYEISYAKIKELCIKLTGKSYSYLTHKARFRICQFALCSRLIQYFEKIASLDKPLVYSKKVITNLFGFSFSVTDLDCGSDIINKQVFSYAHSSEQVDLLSYDLQAKHNPNFEDVKNHCIQEVSHDGRELNLQLLQPFIKWFLREELPVRNYLMAGFHFRKDRETIEEKSERLNKGYSFKALTAIFRDTDNHYRLKDVISIFLDRAIDMGIIVPIVYENKNMQQLCRAFRHGEDLPFGISDRTRLYYFLQQLQSQFKDNQCDGIAQISFEKIIVLFIQMSIREGGIFNQFLGYNNDILSIRYSVHGTIATKIDSSQKIESLKYYFDEAPYWDWITKYLKKNKVIVLEEKTTRTQKGEPIINVYIQPNAFSEYEQQFNNICESIKNKIDQYAALFAEWYSAMQGGRNKFKNQVIQLSTCFSLPSVAIAIATETHYFVRFWENDVKKKHFSEYLSSPMSSIDLAVSSKKIRSGLHSGRDKFKWYEEEKHLTAISEVATALKKKSGYLSNDWRNRWMSISTAKRNNDVVLQDRFYECYCCMLLCYACYELIESGHISDTGLSTLPYEIATRINKYATEYYEIRDNHNVQLDNLDRLFQFLSTDIFKIDDVSLRVSELEKQVDDLVYYVNDIVDKIQTMVSQQIDDLKIHYYVSSVIIEFGHGDQDICNQIIDRSWNELPNWVEKTQINIFNLIASPESQISRYGVFYENLNGLNTNNRKDSLFEKLIREVLALTNRYGINVRVAVIPDLPPQRRVHFQLKSQLQSELDDFNKNICSDVFKLFKENKAQQIVLVEKNIDSQINRSLSNLPGMIRHSSAPLTKKELPWPTTTNYQLTYVESARRAFPVLSPEKSIDNSICSLYLTDDEHSQAKSSPIGTATLFTYANHVYAVTCQHCLVNGSDQIYKLIMKVSDCNPLFGKQIAPAYDLIGLDYDRSAAEEVAILQVFGDKDCKNEAYFASETIMDINIIDVSQEAAEFTCFGYPSKRGVTVHIETYEVANEGYHEYFLAEKEKLSGGMSGALIRDKAGCPIGIIYSYLLISNQHRAYGIPMKTVIEQAIEIINAERNEDH